MINHPREAAAAADGLPFPLAVKPNTGVSGAGIQRFDRAEDLAAAAAQGALDLGIDQTVLVQEFLPARDGHIVRVEVLDGRALYAIKDLSESPADSPCARPTTARPIRERLPRSRAGRCRLGKRRPAVPERAARPRPASVEILELQPVQLCVDAVTGEEGFVRPLFGHTAFVQHENPVDVPDGR